ncbi:MAG: hypothetical protein OHK0028_15180 [Deltaproteobacteria bacterium]
MRAFSVTGIAPYFRNMAFTHASGGWSGKGLPAARPGASCGKEDPGVARGAGTFRLIDSLRFWFILPVSG